MLLAFYVLTLLTAIGLTLITNFSDENLFSVLLLIKLLLFLNGTILGEMAGFNIFVSAALGATLISLHYYTMKFFNKV